MWTFYRLFSLQVCDQAISEKALRNKGFISNFRDVFRVKIIVTISPADVVTNSLSCFFCPFFQTKRQEQSLQKVGGGVTRNFSVFQLQQAVLYFKAIPNLIDFYRGIFLHVGPVCIIVPCFYYANVVQKQYRAYVEMEPNIDCPQLLSCS